MNDNRVVQRSSVGFKREIRVPKHLDPPSSAPYYNCHHDTEECDDMCGVSEFSSIRRYCTHGWRDQPEIREKNVYDRSRPSTLGTPTRSNTARPSSSGLLTSIKGQPMRHSLQREYNRSYEEPHYINHRLKFLIEEYGHDVYNDDEEVFNFYLQNLKIGNDWEDNSLTGLINEYRQNPDSVPYLSRILNHSLKISKMEQELESLKKEMASVRSMLSQNLPTEAAAFSLSNLSGEARYTPANFNYKSVDLLKLAEKIIVTRNGCNIHQKSRGFLRRVFSELVDNDEERLMQLTVRHHGTGSLRHHVGTLISLPEEIVDSIIDFLAELNGWKKGTIKTPEQLVCDTANLKACTDVLNGLRYVRKRAKRPASQIGEIVDDVEVNCEEQISV